MLQCCVCEGPQGLICLDLHRRETNGQSGGDRCPMAFQAPPESLVQVGPSIKWEAMQSKRGNLNALARSSRAPNKTMIR